MMNHPTTTTVSTAATNSTSSYDDNKKVVRKSTIPTFLLRMFSCTYTSIAIFRIVLGTLVTIELVQRYQYLHAFYTNDGTYPLSILYKNIDQLYYYTCYFHCSNGTLEYQQILLSIHIVCSIAYTIGFYGCNIFCAITWYLYLSLTLRNIWLSYILDRYIHYLLFISIFLPLTKQYSVSTVLQEYYQKRQQQQQQQRNSKTIMKNIAKTTPTQEENDIYYYVSPATIVIKGLLLWIYLDAGYGKYQNQGWSFSAYPLPALDTYARHTLVAQYITTIIGGTMGWRILTPMVVYIELLCVPITLLGWILHNTNIIHVAVTCIVTLHIGIALTIRNATLLSFVAISPWITFLPITTLFPPVHNNDSNSSNQTIVRRKTTIVTSTKRTTIVSLLFLLPMIIGNIWFETIGRTSCYTTPNTSHDDDTMINNTTSEQHIPTQFIWSTLLHNRWNVFVGAEEYVTWEIAPGILMDNTTIVDIWKNSTIIDWNLPTTSSRRNNNNNGGKGAPCTATARYGRWRSFPYLSNFTIGSLEYHALWGYLCKEWDSHVDSTTKELMKYNFFMLQADVLPNMQFSATRKRLIVSYDCTTTSNKVMSITRNETNNDTAIKKTEPIDNNQKIDDHNEL